MDVIESKGDAPASTKRGSIIGIDHVQIEVPSGGEELAHAFYVGLLGLTEIERPQASKGRSFLWVAAGSQEVHFRCSADFAPATLAHPGFLVDDLETLEDKLMAAGYTVNKADVVSSRRLHMRDPFGNRLEFIDATDRSEEPADA